MLPLGKSLCGAGFLFDGYYGRLRGGLPYNWGLYGPLWEEIFCFASFGLEK